MHFRASCRSSKDGVVFLHEDNESVLGVLTHLTLKSPATMRELRKMFLLIDKYDIKIRTQYRRSVAIIWAVSLSRVTDNYDWQLLPRIFKHFNGIWGTHTVYQFAFSENKHVSRYTVKWRHGHAEVVDCLRLQDEN